MQRLAKALAKRRQRGVVLMIALIALVAISLAGIALMRSVDAGLMITGNLAFKQTAAQAGDAGTEAALDWIEANSADLGADVAAAGYYATWRMACDLLASRTADANDDVAWGVADAPRPGCGMVAVAVDASRLPDGYTATYVINRMCDSAGAPNDPSVYCSAFLTSSGGTGSTKVGASYGQMPLSGTAQQYYRVTTRVVGPRSTESVVQAIVGF